jgi:hypothetical protein
MKDQSAKADTKVEAKPAESKSPETKSEDKPEIKA